MRGVRGSEAQVDYVHSLCSAPFERSQNNLNVRGEATVEDLDRIKLHVQADFLADRACYGTPLAAVVQVIAAQPMGRHRNAAGDAAHMRMVCMNAAVDDRDFHVASVMV